MWLVDHLPIVDKRMDVVYLTVQVPTSTIGEVGRRRYSHNRIVEFSVIKCVVGIYCPTLSY